MQIQAKEVTKKEKVKQIKELTGEGGDSFKSDLFPCILDGLSKNLGWDMADSSDEGSSYDSENVLKNDNSYWACPNLLISNKERNQLHPSLLKNIV